MSLPIPAISLSGACSVIHNSTLYTYSSKGFQSLPLANGAAEWQTLSMGEPVDGGVCVGSAPADPQQAGLYVVGGARPAGEAMAGAPAACMGQYQGLQKYTYATKKWDVLCPESSDDAVTQSRRYHSAIYVAAVDAILVYAGRQDGVMAVSSQTFTVQASAPYGVASFNSTATPGISPILLPWSDSQVAMVGGDETNSKVMLFDGQAGWTDSGASLADPLPQRIKAALIRADDGSKMLYRFDLTASPAVVDRVVLLDGSGNPVANSATITARDLASNRESLLPDDGGRALPRDLTATSWPAYNSSLAPTKPRAGAAVAQDSDGQVVFTGGDDADHVLSIFDARLNSWQNATAQFDAENSKLGLAKVGSSAPPSTDGLPLATSAPSATDQSAQATMASQGTGGAAGDSPPQQQQGQSSYLNPNVILGAALGSIFGAAIILAITLVLLRHYRRRQHDEVGRARRASGPASPDKEGFGFANDPLPPPPGIQFRKHQPQESQESFSSMAILMGRAGTQPEAPPGPPGHNSNGSMASSLFIVNSHSNNNNNNNINKAALKGTIGKPIPQEPSPQQPPLTHSANEKAISFAPDAAPPRRPPRPSNALDLQATAGARRSSGWNKYWSGGSVFNTLTVGAGASQRTTMNSDQSASSTYSDHHRHTQDSATVPEYLEGRPELNRVNSGSPVIGQYNNSVPLREGMSGTLERPLSSVSSSSGYWGYIPAVGLGEPRSPPTAPRPWVSDRAASPGYAGAAGTAGPAGGPPPPRPPYSGLSRQPQLAMAARSSDMSWLNLGDSGRL